MLKSLMSLKLIAAFIGFRFKKEVVDFMDHPGLGFCTVSAPGLPCQEIYSSHRGVYLRLHGKYNWYDYLYGEGELKDFKLKILQVRPDQAFVIFNNDVGAQAPQNAEQLINLFDLD